MCFVHVRDVAVLHVAAVLDPEIKGERLFASSGEPFNLNIGLSILRRLNPDVRFMDDLPNQTPCLITLEDEQHLLELLKKWGGLDGWGSLERVFRESVELEI